MYEECLINGMRLCMVGIETEWQKDVEAMVKGQKPLAWVFIWGVGE